MKNDVTINKLLDEIQTCRDAGQDDKMILDWINVILNSNKNILDVKK